MDSRRPPAVVDRELLEDLERTARHAPAAVVTAFVAGLALGAILMAALT